MAAFDSSIDQRETAASEFSFGTPTDFAKAAVHSGVENPVNGLVELFGEPLHWQWAESYKSSSLLGKAGELTGTVADFVLLSKAVDKCLPTSTKSAMAGSVGGSALKMGGIGAVYGGILTPPTKDSSRLQSAFGDGITFGAMGGASTYFESLSPAVKTFSQEIRLGAAAGAVGGLADSAATSVWNRHAESAMSVIANTTKYAAFGAMFGVGGQLLDAVAAKPRVRALEAVSTETIAPPLEAEAPPIPLRAENAGTALNYHQMPVDLTHPLTNEPLVNASDLGLSNDSYYYIADGSNAPYNERIPGALPDVWIRKTVAEKLLQVNQRLAPKDLEIHVYDAYRPIETQQALWDHFIEKGRQQLKTDDPQQLRQFAGHFASEPHGFDPANPETWPTHNTGASVDVTLRQKSTGKILDMGSGFDDASDASFTDAWEKATRPELNAARHNRRILHDAMTQEGFTNYPYEWWHYDFGTQMWLQNSALVGSGVKAWYGPATLPVS